MKNMLLRFICAILIISGTLLAIDAPSKADQQAPLPVETFKTTYKGYRTSADWVKSYTNAQRCSRTQTIYGAQPSVPGDYPLLVYLHGTTADWANNKEGQLFVKQAAAQGFVAMAATYTSFGALDEQGLDRNSYCIFDQSHGSQDAMSVMCGVQNVDCDKGVLVSSFSQGANLAVIAKNYNQKISAVWAIGYSAYSYGLKKVVPANALPAPYGTRALPSDKLTITMGEASNLSKKTLIKEDLPSLRQITGYDCGTGYDCVQADGSGYYIVSNAEVKDGLADHCYWMKTNKIFKSSWSCTMSPTEFDPGFSAPSTTKWSMTTKLDWLRSQLSE